ncbi:hypothetical protein B0T18DRAFT_197514 [Schizothecium vesticola]|uniref:Uncharacterized protein n=1 Tax=Schizothecium vesticola TaxID=314040 RepID=A0AA40ERE8_9PEZI|nr:hypothetical protein B0T18DRAFT_197514 [Schizothecium vesticola]
MARKSRRESSCRAEEHRIGWVGSARNLPHRITGLDTFGSADWLGGIENQRLPALATNLAQGTGHRAPTEGLSPALGTPSGYLPWNIPWTFLDKDRTRDSRVHQRHPNMATSLSMSQTASTDSIQLQCSRPFVCLPVGSVAWIRSMSRPSSPSPAPGSPPSIRLDSRDEAGWPSDAPLYRVSGPRRRLRLVSMRIAPALFLPALSISTPGQLL